MLRGDVGAYVVALLVLFPAFLTLAWFGGRLIDRLTSREPARQLLHLCGFGGVGLMFEWIAMGLSPWSNPEASPLLMAVFQLGMFSFWATVAFVPRLWVSTRDADRQTARRVMKFAVGYFGLVYLTVAVVPAATRFVVVIGLVLLGFLTLGGLYLRHIVRMMPRVASNSPAAFDAAADVPT